MLLFSLMPNALLFSGVTQSYGSRTALKNVDFTVAEGEFHAIVGVNGAGKTTLFKCLLDFCAL